ncbi:MAG: DUF2975 domain-containing protein [Eubacteriales bacterium]|nr:DUF2975 domain-containing protein [Eubacteriales bacterium]
MKQKSLKITHIMIKAFYIILALVTVIPPIVYKAKLFDGDIITVYYFTLLAAVLAGAVALVGLDRLMNNLKNKIVFDTGNVKILKTLGWCCFYASLITLLAFGVASIRCFSVIGIYLYSSLFIIGIGEVFVGLVVRVVMHTFENAIEIKDENDLTI